MASKAKGPATTDDLRAELADLRSDMAALVDTLARMAEGEAGSALNSIRDRLSALAETGEETAAKAGAQIKDAFGAVESTIERNPMTAALIALGLGVFIGMTRRS